eukprot:CAMPEP_0113315048 /NCGR_PEP_ID=MMETSP0010_2-20120614/10877_1 /TAXON_ID=216773 ORGANISM="Corethron hystrix, Strain 308" /NCGR_SAMPLE_ID=MMETSP0010_2 /ASSEMBLY_ACC=CAM_ASM_000155 /LENGTH=464 /DNA_ID=CAMNT_0000171481 /DNA_START=219 /DNA_END=1611 /DNA_ORIENTATION=- /assembly_acc=CAM_ASM_000155
MALPTVSLRDTTGEDEESSVLEQNVDFIPPEYFASDDYFFENIWKPDDDEDGASLDLDKSLAPTDNETAAPSSPFSDQLPYTEVGEESPSPLPAHLKQRLDFYSSIVDYAAGRSKLLQTLYDSNRRKRRDELSKSVQQKTGLGGDSHDDVDGGEELEVNTYVSSHLVHPEDKRRGEDSCLSEVVPMTGIGPRTLGVDYGTSRTGMATTVGFAPRPLSFFMNEDCMVGRETSELFLHLLHNLPDDEEEEYYYDAVVSVATAQKIVETANTQGCCQIVVGLPLDKDKTETHQARVTRLFTKVLCCIQRYFENDVEDRRDDSNDKGDLQNTPTLTRPIFLWDERYSSREAEARIMSREQGGGRIPRREQKEFSLDAESAGIILEHFYQAEGEDAELCFVPAHIESIVESALAERIEAEKKLREENVGLELEKIVVGNRDKIRQKAIERAAEMEKLMGLGKEDTSAKK